MAGIGSYGAGLYGENGRRHDHLGQQIFSDE